MISNIIFDVGRVLFEWDLRHLFAKLIDNEADLDWFLANVVTPEWHFQHDAGRPLEEMVAERCAAFPLHADLIHSYRSRFLETIPGPVAGSLEIVEELASRDAPLYAITNFGSEFWGRFRVTQSIFNHFNGILVSGDEKLMKPDPAIYALAMCRFDIAAPSTLFVDDNMANIMAAKKFGLNVHHFTDATALRVVLTSHGLLG